MDTNKKTITKSHNHHHWWIEDEVLYETYETIRGLRYCKVLDVPGMPDNDKVEDLAIVFIEIEYL